MELQWSSNIVSDTFSVQCENHTKKTYFVTGGKNLHSNIWLHPPKQMEEEASLNFNCSRVLSALPFTSWCTRLQRLLQRRDAFHLFSACLICSSPVKAQPFLQALGKKIRMQLILILVRALFLRKCRKKHRSQINSLSCFESQFWASLFHVRQVWCSFVRWKHPISVLTPLVQDDSWITG